MTLLTGIYDARRCHPNQVRTNRFGLLFFIIFQCFGMMSTRNIVRPFHFTFNSTGPFQGCVPFHLYEILCLKLRGPMSKSQRDDQKMKKLLLLLLLVVFCFSSCLKVCPKHPTLATYSPPNDIPTNQPTNQRSQADSRGWLQFGRWICLGPGGP